MNEKSSRRFWIALILGFFSIDLTIAIVAISMAAGDPSFRSIPGFGKRSVQWADRQQQQRNIQDLGVTIEFDLEASTNSELVIRINDRDGQPIRGLKLSLEAFHFTRVAEQQKRELLERDDCYVALLKMEKPGYWHIEMGGELFGKLVWLERTIDWKGPSS